MRKIQEHSESNDNPQWSQDAMWVWLAVKIGKMKKEVIEGSYGGKNENEPVRVRVVDNLVKKIRS